MTHLSDALGGVHGALAALDQIPGAAGVDQIRRDLYEVRNELCALMARDHQATLAHYGRMVAEVTATRPTTVLRADTVHAGDTIVMGDEDWTVETVITDTRDDELDAVTFLFLEHGRPALLFPTSPVAVRRVPTAEIIAGLEQAWKDA